MHETAPRKSERNISDQGEKIRVNAKCDLNAAIRPLSKRIGHHIAAAIAASGLSRKDITPTAMNSFVAQRAPSRRGSCSLLNLRSAARLTSISGTDAFRD